MASTEGRTGRAFDGVEVGDVCVNPLGKAAESRRRGDALRTFTAWTRGHVPETGRTLPPQPRV